MNVDRMRWVDRWVGVPTCFLLTLHRRLMQLFGRREGIPPDGPKNILLIELAEMGSLVLTCPSVQRLKAHYPNSRVHALVFSNLKQSVMLLGLAADDNIFTIDSSSLFTVVRDALRFMVAARRRQIDTVVNLEMFTRVSAILGYLSGARAVAGFDAFEQRGMYAGRLLTHRVAYNPHIHTSQAFIALVDSLGADPANLPVGKFPVAEPVGVPRITSDDAARQVILDLVARRGPGAAGKRLILVNPNASPLIEIRKWPLASYTQLVRRLLEHPDYACVITGVASEQADARVIVEGVKNDRVVDLTGQTSFRQLIDLYNVADLLVTNDSGPAQFAALTGIDVVVFFGPETPKLYGPLTDRCTVMYSNYACSPCVNAYNQRLTPCTDNQCLKTIQVDTVHATIQRLLANRRAASAASHAAHV